MARKAHKLKKIKGTEKKLNWIFFDTETKPEEKTPTLEVHKLYLGVAQYYRLDKKTPLRDECVFTDTATFANFIIDKTRKNTALTVMSMNLAFDFTACDLSIEMKNRGYELKQLMVEGKVSIIKYKGKDHSILFLDLFNYVKSSVKALGELLGLPKLDVDFDDVDDETLTTYCRRDVEIVARFMIQYISFVDLHDLGCLGPTTPSQAFNAFRHRFMADDIMIHSIEKASELERSSYFGGRTECFQIGKIREKIYYVDVNSMYPDVMREELYPTRLIHYFHKGAELDILEDHLINQAAVAEVELITDQPAYPMIHDKRLIFPVGKFTTTLCTKSLKYALAHGHIVDVKRLSVYAKRDIFSAYVTFFYNLRLYYKGVSNKVYDAMVKLFLNSLYGKFGQRVRDMVHMETLETDNTETVEVYDKNGKKLYDQVIFAGEVFHHFIKQKESFNSFVAIASHVTDNARMKLWGYIQEAGLDNVFYCDTDSLFLNHKGFIKIHHHIDPSQLGKLAVEATYNHMTIHSLKDYETPDYVRLKGVKRTAKKIGYNTYEQLNFPSFKGLIRAGITDRLPIKTVTKTLQRKYSKGVILPSDRTAPYYFE